ncbi:MAG: hypothetical protein ACE5IH_01205, partial [Thermodesulfobacteriota bacterium]
RRFLALTKKSLFLEIPLIIAYYPEAAVMLPFEKCPICGGDMVEKKIEKLLRVCRGDTAVILLKNGGLF